MNGLFYFVPALLILLFKTLQLNTHLSFWSNLLIFVQILRGTASDQQKRSFDIYVIKSKVNFAKTPVITDSKLIKQASYAELELSLAHPSECPTITAATFFGTNQY
jgi:hypothetical protein